MVEALFDIQLIFYDFMQVQDVFLRQAICKPHQGWEFLVIIWYVGAAYLHWQRWMTRSDEDGAGKLPSSFTQGFNWNNFPVSLFSWGCRRETSSHCPSSSNRCMTGQRIECRKTLTTRLHRLQHVNLLKIKFLLFHCRCCCSWEVHQMGWWRCII